MNTIKDSNVDQPILKTAAESKMAVAKTTSLIDYLRTIAKAARSWILVNVCYRGARIGKGFHVAKEGKVYIHAKTFVAGDFVYIGPYTEIGPDVSIGNFTLISSYVNITGADHIFDKVRVPIRYSGRPQSIRTVIGADVLVGHGATIMRGTTIGDGAIVGAGAVVTKDIPPYAIAVGVPARVSKYRFSPADQVEHSKMLAEPTVEVEKRLRAGDARRSSR